MKLQTIAVTSMDIAWRRYVGVRRERASGGAGSDRGGVMYFLMQVSK